MLSLSKKYICKAFFIVFFPAIFFSCGEKTPAPAGKITVKLNGNVAEFNVEATDAQTFEWDFGDGSPKSDEQNPVHTFNEFGREYTVTLKMTGPGGEKILTETVSIREMTNMEILSGGETDPDGRRWRLSSTANGFRAVPNTTLTVIQTYSPGFLRDMGFVNAYLDEFIFKSNGDYSIKPKAQGIIAGLTYCTSKNIPNTPPGQDAISKGLTLINSFVPPQGLKFAFNESRSLSINVSDGNSSTDIVFPDVMTLSFSKGGFLGLNNWITDCIITDLKKTSMKVVFFTSNIPVESQNAGKTNGVLLLTFELVE
jgi:PKD repeat protein